MVSRENDVEIWKKYFSKEGVPSTIFEDDLMVAFHDIRPRAKLHVLVVPKQHIRGSESLDERHLPLLKKMHEVGKQVLSENSGLAHSTDLEKDFIFGFHRYPLRSVNHLHMHCLLRPLKHEVFNLSFTEWLPRYGFISLESVFRQIAPDEPNS